MSRSVLVLNAGSSSLKYALYKFGEITRCAVVGIVEQIGGVKSSITHKVLNEESKADTMHEALEVSNHKYALSKVVSMLNLGHESIYGVGHRVVHGGEGLTKPSIITETVKQAIVKATTLAPLHNPANLEGISVAEELFDCPQVAVFDTAFHSTIPAHAYMYALPLQLYKELGVRRYGFHGTSYTYLVDKTAELVGRPAAELNMIILHLGAGASLAAVERGVCVDTTMGVTPLEGLVMATRSGDVDAGVCKLLADERGMSPAAVDALLNKQSGLLGLCGDKDMRSVVDRAQSGDQQAALALAVFVHRVRKYLGAFLVHLRGHVDAIVFSAGIGEHSPRVRELICQDLESLGIKIDATQNWAKSSVEIQAEDSKTKILVVPTDEELCIAQQTLQVIQHAKLSQGA